MTKWIKFSRSSWGFASSLALFNKINFYVGWADHWGLGFDVNFYDRALTFNVLNVYFGVEIWHKDSDTVEIEYQSHPPKEFRDIANGE